jgi:ribose/xylose/arabinose/galactoside ABC-type transport system permease subunit
MQEMKTVESKKPTGFRITAKKAISGGYGSSIALILLFIVASIISPYFLTTINITNLLRQVSVYGFMSLGLTLVILSGGIDLSVGGVMTLSSLLSAVLCFRGYNDFYAVSLGIGIGVAFGLANGLIIALFKVESFVVTLGTQFVAFGLGYSLSGGKTVLPDLSPFMLYLSNGYIGPIPFPVILLLSTYAIFGFLMSNTAFGRHIHALGGNEKASKFCGINTAGIKVAVYTISGFLAGIAGVLLLSRSSVGDPTAGLAIVLFIIASVIVGGNHFVGGIGNVGFTLVGLLILGILGNILNMLGVVFYVQQIVQGAIVVFAVVVSTRME